MWFFCSDVLGVLRDEGWEVGLHRRCSTQTLEDKQSWVKPQTLCRNKHLESHWILLWSRAVHYRDVCFTYFFWARQILPHFIWLFFFFVFFFSFITDKSLTCDREIGLLGTHTNGQLTDSVYQMSNFRCEDSDHIIITILLLQIKKKMHCMLIYINNHNNVLWQTTLNVDSHPNPHLPAPPL